MTNGGRIFPRSEDTHTCYLKNVVRNPNIRVGDYTCYHDFGDAMNFEKNVLYAAGCTLDRLIIGKFCWISSGVKFLMTGGKNKLSSVASYPFPIMTEEWGPSAAEGDEPSQADIIIGNDVWIGFEALILSGVNIGDGAIIGTRAVVTKDVPPYGIVLGVPGHLIRKRFDEETIEALLKLRWWDWTPEKISQNLDAIRSADVRKLLERA